MITYSRNDSNEKFVQVIIVPKVLLHFYLFPGISGNCTSDSKNTSQRKSLRKHSMNFLEYILNKEEEHDNVNKIGKIPLPDNLEDPESPRKDQSSALIDIDAVLSSMNLKQLDGGNQPSQLQQQQKKPEKQQVYKQPPP